MKFPPVYQKTEKINKDLRDLEILRAAYTLHPLPPSLTLQLQRKSILKSSLYSARIEGNPLTVHDLSGLSSGSDRQMHVREIQNIQRAIEMIYKSPQNDISVPVILSLHSIVMDGISGEAGHFRDEDTAIYNQAGIAVYVVPAHADVYRLIEEWVGYCDESSGDGPIQAALSHVWFEKIHPFLDGNGRVGRLAASLLLKKNAFDFGGLVPIEEYIDNHREEYYDALGFDTQDQTKFVEFFLTALLSQATSMFEQAQTSKPDPFAHLLPRRQEIVQTISDHTMVTMDFLARRFRAVPQRTLHYDVSQLIKQGIIRKLGSTRGALYTINTPDKSI